MAKLKEAQVSGAGLPAFILMQRILPPPQRSVSGADAAWGQCPARGLPGVAEVAALQPSANKEIEASGNKG